MRNATKAQPEAAGQPEGAPPVLAHAPILVRSRSPLRLGFAGGGTDVAPFCDDHGGCVMNVTIGLYAYAHLGLRTDGQVRFHAADIDQLDVCEAVAELDPSGPAMLHRGVYNRMVRDFNGGQPLPVDVTTTVEAPQGSGLGSSSALVVALVEAYREYLRVPLTPYDVARLAFSIEREDLGLAGGGQDQYAAAFGGFNFIEFQSRHDVIVNALRVHPALMRELESSILLYFTGRSRDSSEVIRQQQRNMVSHDPGALAALRALKDEAVQMKAAVLKGNVAALGRILNSGWEQKKRTAAAVTTPEIDALFEGIFQHGAFAAKLSGAGGGGFMFMLCEPTRRHELAKYLKDVGPGELLPCHFTERGVESWRLG